MNSFGGYLIILSQGGPLSSLSLPIFSTVKLKFLCCFFWHLWTQIPYASDNNIIKHNITNNKTISYVYFQQSVMTPTSALYIFVYT